MNTKLLPWIIAGIFLVWAVLATTCSGSDDQNDKIVELQTKISTREAAIHEMGRNYTALRTKMRQDSILYRDTIVSKQKEIVQHKSNIKRLRSKPEVIEIVKQNPVIDTIFTYYDSVTTAQNFVIYSQEKQIAQMQVDANEMERNFQFRLSEQAKNFEDQKAISAECDKELKKEKREGKGKTLAIVGAALLGLFGGSQL